MSTSNINEQVKNLINEREKDCINRYVKKMKELEKVKYIKNENKVRDKVPENHIMYKMKFGKTTFLEKDGRKYEFLIEFDKKDYSYGIYYGCKCILDESKDILEQIKTCEYEWKDLREDVNNYLKLTFDIDFEKRENVSNNANDNTYWPFWYRLGDDEDITVVAALAIKIISNVYKYVLIDGNKLEKVKKNRRGIRKIEIIPKYDCKSYDEITKQRSDIKILIDTLQKEEYLTKHPILEKCWMINKDKIEIGNFMYVMSIYLKLPSILKVWALTRYSRIKVFKKEEKNVGRQDYLKQLSIQIARECMYDENMKERSDEDIQNEYKHLSEKIVKLMYAAALNLNDNDKNKIKDNVKDILKLNLDENKLKGIQKELIKDQKEMNFSYNDFVPIVDSIDDIISQLLYFNEKEKDAKAEWKNLDKFIISHTGTPIYRTKLSVVNNKEAITGIMEVIINLIYNNKIEPVKKSEGIAQDFLVELIAKNSW